MASNSILSRANRIRTKLQTTLRPTLLDLEDCSHQHAGHAGHAAVKSSPNGPTETHFNLRIVSSLFEGKTLVNRHRMVYDAITEELESGLHALSIVAKTPQEYQKQIANK